MVMAFVIYGATSQRVHSQAHLKMQHYTSYHVRACPDAQCRRQSNTRSNTGAQYSKRRPKIIYCSPDIAPRTDCSTYIEKQPR